MQLRQLELFQFRNLLDQTISFPSRITLIVGKNGQGKTSLLEAVFFLAHAKSFRESRSRELIRWGQEQRGRAEARVSGTVETVDGEKLLECRFNGGKSSAFLNGNRIERAAGFYGQLASVVFTPDELQLVKGPPHGRRTFIDRVFASVDRGYVDEVVQYQRAVKSRNALMAEARERGVSLQELRRDCQPWNQLVARHGVAIVERRLRLLNELSPKVEQYYRSLLGEQQDSGLEEIQVGYQSRFAVDGVPIGVEAAFELLEVHLEKDLARRSTGVGPHRDDVDLLLESGFGFKPARIAASQGQARSLALALKLAAIDFLNQHLGEPPVVLLDDVESELDRYRKQALYELVSTFESQVIITATEVSEQLGMLLGQAEVQGVSGGKITPKH